MSNCFFRIMFSDTGTIVKINGVVLTNAINNLYYEVQTNQPCLIEASKTVLVAQYFTTINKCDNYSENDYGDPEIIYLLPFNEDINSINIYASPHNSIEEQYINVTLATKDTASFFLDNVQQHGVFKTFFL